MMMRPRCEMLLRKFSLSGEDFRKQIRTAVKMPVNMVGTEVADDCGAPESAAEILDEEP